MACKRALKRLAQAKNSDKECLKHNICPKCGSNVTRIGVSSNQHVKRCMSCNTTYGDYDDNNSRIHPEGG